MTKQTEQQTGNAPGISPVSFCPSLPRPHSKDMLVQELYAESWKKVIPNIPIDTRTSLIIRWQRAILGVI